MEWATLATLIATYGIPFAEFLIQKIQAKGEVTPEEWAQLKQLASANAQSEMIAQLKAAGIDPESPQGKAFLALTSGPAPVVAPVSMDAPSTPGTEQPTPVPESPS